ncbi:MAG: DegV family protein [Oscillospiraceae bacterium]|nr:DegV family protein [Oscillospiraceae bacterium]
MKTKIIVDSTADLTPEVAEQLTVVPLSIRFGDVEYVHGQDLTNQEFYEKLVESDVLPTTSQPTPFAFEEEYRKAVEAGQEAVVITLSPKLSGTYQSATVAAAEFPGKIHVVDSENVTIGAGILAEYALRLAKEGLSAPDITRELEKQKKRIHLLAMVDTLEYLKKGGRISKTVAFAGELLQLKPVLRVRDGEIKVIGKARGSRQGNNLLVQEIKSAGGVDFTMPLLLGYTGMTDVLLQKYIRDSAALWEGHVDTLPQTIVGSVVGTHAGPGAVAVAFFAEE